VTAAPTITWPLGSVTEPLSEPDVICADAAMANTNAKPSANARFFIINLLHGNQPIKSHSQQEGVKAPLPVAHYPESATRQSVSNKPEANLGDQASLAGVY
jgi:hypothetical protein